MQRAGAKPKGCRPVPFPPWLDPHGTSPGSNTSGQQLSSPAIRDTRSASAKESTEWITENAFTTPRTLLRCNRPMKCHCRDNPTATPAFRQLPATGFHQRLLALTRQRHESMLQGGLYSPPANGPWRAASPSKSSSVQLGNRSMDQMKV